MPVTIRTLGVYNVTSSKKVAMFKTWHNKHEIEL